jgi:hypothetical protein
VSDPNSADSPSTPFPKNFDRLHEGEEFHRGKTKAAIAASDDLLRHFNAIAEAMTAIDYFARSYAHTGDDELTIQLLGIRLFNSAAGAVQSLMGGYYQNSVMLQRDLLEVAFLIDFFRSNRKRIVEWRGCTESERNQKFRAFLIRNALDDRDGFTERKREAHYKLLCSLGAHASWQGFELLRPIAGGEAHCGPYFADRALDATASELAKICITAAEVFVPCFKPSLLRDYEAMLRFMEAKVGWLEYFFDPVDKGQLDRMRNFVARMRRKGSDEAETGATP